MHFALTFLLLLVNLKYVILHNKCCDSGSYLKKEKSTYHCDKDESKRLQVFTNQTNYLKNINGTESDETICFDTNKTHIVEYKIKNRTVIGGKQIEVNYFTKCCPLNSYYNSITHACVESENSKEDFITQNFVRVGLPHCRIVVDYELNSGKNYHRLELGNLYINGSRKFQEGQFCIDVNQNNTLIARGCHAGLDVCKETRCIRKCCPDGKSFHTNSTCVDTYKYGLDLSFSEKINKSQDPFGVIHGHNCSLNFFRDDYNFHLDLDGSLWIFYNRTNSYIKFGYDEQTYCIENFYSKKRNENNFKFFRCRPESSLGLKFLITRWLKLLSCIFITLTIVTYILLPELLNLFGKILVSYCLATFASFAVLTYSQFEINPSDLTCVAISFLAIYSSLCSFAWLNVMCFDIWWTFGTPKSFVTTNYTRNQMNRFLLYSLHGWGTPALITLITFGAYIAESTPPSIKPYIGAYKYLWDDRPGNYGRYLFFAMPLTIMEVMDLIFFTKTIIYCIQVKDAINQMNDNRISLKEKKKNFKTSKEQLVLILKLSVIMGISFVFEVVSTFYVFSENVVTKYIEVVWDIINCSQGIFIFIIFICKKKVLGLCREKICPDKTRRVSLTSLTELNPPGQDQLPLSSTSKGKNT